MDDFEITVDRSDFQAGVAFEGEVRQSLKGLGCDLRSSEKLDQDKKVDFFVRSVDGVALHPRVAFQLTMQCENFTKLEKFCKAVKDIHIRRFCYVEVDRRCRPHKAASAIRKHLRSLARLPRAVEGKWSLVIDADGTLKATKLEDRYGQLRRMVERGVQVIGWIESIDPHAGFVVTDLHRTRYWTFDGDVADRALLRRIERHRKERENLRGVFVAGRWVLTKREPGEKRLAHVQSFEPDIEFSECEIR